VKVNEGWTDATLRLVLFMEGLDRQSIETFMILWHETDLTAHEITRLRWSDIDQERGVIRLREEVGWDGPS
jgi:hypothetical protein